LEPKENFQWGFLKGVWVLTFKNLGKLFLLVKPKELPPLKLDAIDGGDL